MSTTCSGCCASSRPPRAWSRRRCARPAKRRTPHGVIYFGSTTPAMHEALEHAGGAGRPSRRAAPARLPVRRRGGRLHRRATRRCSWSSRTATRQLRTLLMNECGVDPAKLVAGAALRRHADHRPLHHRRDLQRCAVAARDAAQRGGRMTYIAKPRLHHPLLPPNALGFTRRDYEGTVSTLCAGCGHDSISAAIIQACFELDLPPHRLAKLSGIGCSSKTPDYFLGNSHGFNTVHGRMPSVLTGANLANRDLIYLGVSGDGDSRLDRPRPVRPLDPARRQHDLHRREQRRLRPDQGPVLGHLRQGLEDQARRGQPRPADRSGRPGAAAGRDLRRPQLLRRQGPAGAADQGGARAQGRGVHRRASAPACSSTTMPARPRASTTCASTTRR